jgi:hypothetical protein
MEQELESRRRSGRANELTTLRVGEAPGKVEADWPAAGGALAVGLRASIDVCRVNAALVGDPESDAGTDVIASGELAGHSHFADAVAERVVEQYVCDMVDRAAGGTDDLGGAVSAHLDLQRPIGAGEDRPPAVLEIGEERDQVEGAAVGGTIT